MKIKSIILGCSLLMLVGCTERTTSNKKNKEPKNVILLISDGTGLSQISSAFFFKDSKPNYTRFKNIGLIKTSSSRQDITDSAAGATAFACGVKTYNGAIGVADDSTSVKNIVELVSLKNIKTGMIATSSITHATPASFYAHVVSRSLNDDIASDLVDSGVDYFAAGGLQHFNKRKDGRNLLKELNKNKFKVDTTGLKDFSEIKSKKKVGYLLAKDAMPKMEEGRGNFLSDATEQAIQFLSQDNSNFFIMSEGSQIDWGGHQNDADYLISELIDFDDAIGKALDFAVISGAQLGRDALKRIRKDGANKDKPTINSEDIRGSHEYAADADNGMMIYRGGIYGTANSHTGNSHIGEMMFEPDLPGTILSCSEVYFLLAEAAARGITGLDMTAAEYYDMGITASFTEWGVTGASDYLANPNVAYDPSGDWKQQIGHQAWLALYNRGFEGWTTWRRLDFDGFNPPPGMTASDIPTRLLFPAREASLNGANWTAAGVAIGGDTKTTKLWWDKN